MPSLKAIKRRISSVKNTKQITRAMRMVAAAKLRRAQDSMMQARPYSDRLRGLIRDLAARADRDAHPLLAKREPRHVCIVVITSDRGLAGGFNSNIIRRAEKVVAEWREKADDVKLIAVGRKGYEHFRKRGAEFIQHHTGMDRDFNYGRALSISEAITRLYVESGEQEGDAGLDRVFLIYNSFVNTIQQEITVDQLFPIEPDPAVEEENTIDYIYEPSEAAVLDHVLPLYANVTMWRVLLESIAAEHAARMNAMENATNNADDLIDKLTLEYNKARQAAITNEILEVVSGAEAQK